MKYTCGNCGGPIQFSKAQLVSQNPNEKKPMRGLGTTLNQEAKQGRELAELVLAEYQQRCGYMAIVAENRGDPEPETVLKARVLVACATLSATCKKVKGE